MDVVYGETTKQNGDLWTYFRCPNEKQGVKCFVTCGTSESCTFDVYIDQILHTLHPCYHLSDGEDDKIPFMNMECFCPRGVILALSKSKNNPNRLYFKCASQGCNFFPWGDTNPVGKVSRWLTSRIHPEDDATMRRKPPPNLSVPGRNYRRPFEATAKATKATQTRFSPYSTQSPAKVPHRGNQSQQCRHWIAEYSG